MGEKISIGGLVEMWRGKLALLIPLDAGGAGLVEAAGSIGHVEGGRLIVVIERWLAEQLGIEEGSFVHVDNLNGKFTITPSVGDGATMSSRDASRGRRSASRWRTAALFIVVVGVAVAGTVAYFKTNRYEIVLTESQIQAALAEHFPVTETYLLVVEATYSEPAVTLSPGSDRIRVRLSANVGLNLPVTAKRVHGSCELLTGIEYRPDTHQLFLSDPQVEKLAIRGVTPEVLETIRLATRKAVTKHLQSFPLYTIKRKDLRSDAGWLLLQEVKVQDGALHLALGLSR